MAAAQHFTFSIGLSQLYASKIGPNLKYAPLIFSIFDIFLKKQKYAKISTLMSGAHALCATSSLSILPVL